MRVAFISGPYRDPRLLVIVPEVEGLLSPGASEGTLAEARFADATRKPCFLWPNDRAGLVEWLVEHDRDRE